MAAGVEDERAHRIAEGEVAKAPGISVGAGRQWTISAWSERGEDSDNCGVLIRSTFFVLCDNKHFGF
jgi:hypothetical protein